jgi:predicted esterase YcpF (UPF0227 family)
MSSEYKILNNYDNLIICFGGMALKMGGILPFEFLNYLSKTYNNCDLIFFIDKNQCWYHKGIDGITSNIDETVEYLNKLLINKGINERYKKILFMGISAGGYASILFGSLCNVNNVIAFIPRTKLINPIDEKYQDLKNIVNTNTQYKIIGHLCEKDVNNNHHISQCRNLNGFENVKVIELRIVNLKKLRDNGYIKTLIDNILDE